MLRVKYFVPTSKRVGGAEEGDEETDLTAFAAKTSTEFENDGKVTKTKITSLTLKQVKSH